MPELPEVQALVTDLGARLGGRTVHRLDLVSFAALKTFDPPVSALSGMTVNHVTRHGKFLDLEIGELHLIIHLARAGWIRWREGAPGGTGRPGKGPLAARLVLDDGSGFDVTEAGTKKSLAIHLVRNPGTSPESHDWDPTHLGRGSPRPSSRPSSRRKADRRSRACCATSRSSPASVTPIQTRFFIRRRCPRTSLPP